jgi:Spy/CpxP family protein refolding chaperone
MTAQPMKLKLITLTALGALALGSSVLANDQDTDRQGGRGGMRHGGLERLTEDLNLTPDQKTKVQPIIDQAQPQLESIRREAMEKTKTVMDNTMSQIRPLLTAEQQKKLDEMKNDRHGFRGGHRHHRDQGDQTDDGSGQ